MQPVTTTTQNGSVYDYGVRELHQLSADETLHRRIDNEFREARGREGARLHVLLRAVSESDRRQLEAIQSLAAELQEKASQLSHLIETFESTADRRFNGVHDDLRQRADALSALVRESTTTIQQTLWNQAETNFNTLSSQSRESTERLAFDVRKLRDEVISLVDSRMNQADASFAALRGDVEVVKFLVMDLIKDRIGRSDPKQKPF